MRSAVLFHRPGLDETQKKKPGEKMTRQEFAKIIDHTAIKPTATQSDVERLCAEAIEHGFGTVCIAPCWIKHAQEIIAGHNVKIGSVVGFPHGNTLTRVKRFEADHILDLGADEIDMVMNISAFKSGLHSLVVDDISAVVAEAKQSGEIIVKVIIETPLLGNAEEKRQACRFIVEGGADFVKTSTGFYETGATAEDIAVMKSTVGDAIGVKAAGAIRDFKTAASMIQAGAARIGASESVNILHGYIDGVI
jgi:deoxyribose-phosphate aldolase